MASSGKLIITEDSDYTKIIEDLMQLGINTLDIDQSIAQEASKRELET